MSHLVLVRHGQSAWNQENRFTGWVDVELTDLGQNEARSAGERLKAKGFKFDMAFSSVLKRANNTLAIILEVLEQTALPIYRDEALNERHYGDLQGKDKAQTAQEFGEEQVQVWRRSYDIAPPNGESLKNTAERTLPYFENEILPKLKENKNILIAAHGNSLRSIAMMLNNLSPDEIVKFEFPTGVPLIYSYDANSGKISSEGFLSC